MQGLQSVSTLMDGELEGDEAAREIARLKVSSADAPGRERETWDAYHLIGDVMRDGAAGVPLLSAGFSTRFCERLAQEPTVLAPRAMRVPRVARKVQAYALSAAASVAAVAVVAWMALGTPGTPSLLKPDTPAVLAQAPLTPRTQPLVAVLPPQFAKAHDAASKHMHEYLLAHQGISPTTAIQGVAPYIRTVSTTGE